MTLRLDISEFSSNTNSLNSVYPPSSHLQLPSQSFSIISNMAPSAAMAEKSALGMLPPELQLRILSNVDTPDYLHALIQASPRLHQVFVFNKETVLSAVARRQFHPSVISDALFFAQISQLEQPLPRETVLACCRVFPTELDEGEFPTGTAISEALCKLATNLRFFIEDYCRNTLPLMEELGQSLCTSVLPEYSPAIPLSGYHLSDSEVGRLQRAFCRFEIYRSLFARCSPEFDHDARQCAHKPTLTSEEQASLFLERFPDFQVAEINCIRDYLYRRLRGICSQLEDQAVGNLAPETFSFDSEGDVESEEWASGNWLFCKSGKYHQTEQIEHLMSLGLRYIRRIFESTGEERKDLFIRHRRGMIISHMTREFITRALELLGRIPGRGDIPLLKETDPPFVYEVNSDVMLDIPDAWQWAYPLAPPLSFSDYFHKGLRDWGYVFWDLDRLRSSGILERR